MAARLRQFAYPHYVYHLVENGKIQYIGKGSGRRLSNQIRNFKLSGYIACVFRSEEDAYRFEIQQIAEHSPALNIHPGGNGSRTKKRISRLTGWQKEMKSMGTQVYAARLLMKYAHLIDDKSKVDQIREVAYGRAA